MPELTRRYVVMAMATEAPFDLHDPDAPFVLKPWKDPAALRALKAYRAHCYPELGGDLEAWIQVIEAGPVVRGDVGRRNEPHVKAAPAVARRPAARRGTGGRHRPAERKGRAGTRAPKTRPRKKHGR